MEWITIIAAWFGGGLIVKGIEIFLERSIRMRESPSISGIIRSTMRKSYFFRLIISNASAPSEALEVEYPLSWRKREIFSAMSRLSSIMSMCIEEENRRIVGILFSVTNRKHYLKSLRYPMYQAFLISARGTNLNAAEFIQ